ncbi:endospore germination permease [Paenibacillus sp. HWE-109]|uniref:GerAB/ArcD/ProY family transporter n=1 Tax=Paenibacillus sp. HWE-109 TaxID=1306526 RepID=UPI001EDE2D3C|nr:endospore germination permease [Paenibacillus sp. HWE-109]UKS24083.1 endospore germination permease [Paenibacillus sp. HWE-109]
MLQLDKGMISARQFTIIVILLMIGDSILIMPSDVASNAHQDAWIAGLLGIGYGLMATWNFTLLGGLYPKLSLIQYTPIIVGRWLGALINIIFLIYFMMTTMGISWEIGDFITSNVMPETPIEVIELLFYGAMIYAVRLGLGPIIRAGEVFFPWVVLILLVLIFMLAPAMELSQVKPILEHGVKPVLLGMLQAGTFPFVQMSCLLIILPQIKDSKKVKKNFLIGALIGGLALEIVLSQSILVLGEYLTGNTLYVSYALAKQVNVGNFLQRVEALIAVLWIITTFIKATIYFYVLNVGIAQFLKLKDYKMLTIPTAAICYALIFISAPNTSYFNDVASKKWLFYDMTIGLAIPLLLLAVYIVRKNKLKRMSGMNT